MNKFLDAIKKILLVTFLAMLGLNAGIDIAHYVKERQAEARVAKSLGGLPGMATEVHKCYLVPDKGWLCDIELREVGGEGRSLRGAKLFTFEDLSNE